MLCRIKSSRDVILRLIPLVSLVSIRNSFDMERDLPNSFFRSVKLCLCLL